MKYILGAGISGLLYAFYHPDYVVLTDQVGRVITGADAVVWLNATELTHKLIADLYGSSYPRIVREKKIGYLSAGQLINYDELMDRDLDDILLKKMVPWEAIDMARRSGVEMRITTPRRAFTKDSGVIKYLDVDVQEVGARLISQVGRRLLLGYRVAHVTEDVIETASLKLTYERVVSTIPAPVFARIWAGFGWVAPRFHYCPVTFVISRSQPSWWDDEYAMVYDADLSSPVSRVGRFGSTWRYEFTGRLDQEVLDAYLPVPDGIFVNPYGRIVQDVMLESPPKITFLGRAAEWNYRGLIDRTLERVHGLR